MQAWEKMFSPSQIKNLASFIKTIKGTKPANAKAPQGDLFTETAKADSAAVSDPTNK
jgi:cytochrome c oxidase cbb3-type subunit 3